MKLEGGPEFKQNPDLSDSDRSEFCLNCARCLMKRGGCRGKCTRCGAESEWTSEGVVKLHAVQSRERVDL